MYKETHEFTWQAWNTKSAVGSTIGNEIMTNIMKDVIVYRHADTDYSFINYNVIVPKFVF
jgi:hypothetical protein